METVNLRGFLMTNKTAHETIVYELGEIIDLAVEDDDDMTLEICSKIKTLLDTHTVVPNEPTEEMLYGGLFDASC